MFIKLVSLIITIERRPNVIAQIMGLTIELPYQASPETSWYAVMKKQNTYILLVALVSIRGLDSLKRGIINPNDPYLDGEPGKVAMQIEADPRTARKLLRDIKRARRHHDSEYALQVLDSYIKPWRVIVESIATGNSVTDARIKSAALDRGQHISIAI